MPSAPNRVAADLADRLRAAGCVFAEDEARMILAAAHGPAEVAAMAERRAAGVPLEHVVGFAEFCGLRIFVADGVFVPRRRTEFLVRQAASLAPRDAVVLDLCCGSGALGVGLVSVLEDAELHAADIDSAAVRCAARNVRAVGGRVYEGDLFAPLPAGLRGRVDVLLSNVPYVPTGELGFLPAEARDHEARVSLDGGTDGLDVLRRVVRAAPRWLAPGGHVLFETSARQAADAIGVVTGAGLAARITADEELGATVVIGTNPHH
jgi:release factor glutamine methyltransferase